MRPYAPAHDPADASAHGHARSLELIAAQDIVHRIVFLAPCRNEADQHVRGWARQTEVGQRLDMHRDVPDVRPPFIHQAARRVPHPLDDRRFFETGSQSGHLLCE